MHLLKYIQKRKWEKKEHDSSREVAQNKIESQKKGQRLAAEAVELASQEMRWTNEEAAQDLKQAKDAYSLTNIEYIVNKFYRIQECDREKIATRIIQEREYQKNNKRSSDSEEKLPDEHIQKIMDATGWSRETVIAKVLDAEERTGSNIGNYYNFKFWELTDEEQETYPTRGLSRIISDKYSREFRQHRRMFYYKDLFLEKAEPYLGRKWASTLTVTWPEFREKFLGETRIIYKPRADKGGFGIEVFNYSSEKELQDVFVRLQEMPLGVVESFIIQHHEMQRYSTNAVNTLRFVTIRTNNPEKGIEVGITHFIYGGIRMGCGSSYVDNLHGGGMVAAFDINTGEVVTDAVDYANNVLEYHPETMAKIKGFIIPYFDESKKMIETISNELDLEGYFGWDIAITETGPVIVEGNNMPGVGMLQLPYLPLKKGMRHVLDRYL